MSTSKNPPAPKTFKIIIPTNITDYPKSHEISAAKILAEYFQAEVRFIAKRNLHTADFIIKNTEWELKSPIGSGKNNIKHQLERAYKQSPRIVIDLRRTKIPDDRLIRRIKHQLSILSGIKQLLVITKSEKILEINH